MEECVIGNEFENNEITSLNMHLIAMLKQCNESFLIKSKTGPFQYSTDMYDEQCSLNTQYIAFTQLKTNKIVNKLVKLIVSKNCNSEFKSKLSIL